MMKILVQISSLEKIYAFSNKNLQGEVLSPKSHQAVLVENDNIIEEGRVVSGSEADVEEGKGGIVRMLGAEDRCLLCELKKNARLNIEEAQNLVYRHNLNMKILDADLSYDQKKLTFYFIAQGRVDFRGLVIALVKSFDKIIRLQQVGARDEARLFGGIGKCGRELCCAKFLQNHETITLEMAQSQELAGAGAGKLAGCCGKLMCCLVFETENYQKLKKIRLEEKET